ncbi:MAG: glutamate ligase domain-containing protein [Pseudomonadota bacterium]
MMQLEIGGLRYPIAAGEMVVGSGADCTIRLSGDDVQPRHAIVQGLANGAAAIRRAAGRFRAVAHRIEFVRDLRGVQFYNDSKGTNVASTMKALESFDERIVLIAGGKGQGQDFTPLAEAARGRVRHLVTIGEDGPKIAAALGAAGGRVLRQVMVPVPALRLAGRAALIVARLAGKPLMLRPDKVNELRHPDWVCRDTRLTEATGWHARFSLTEGFRDAAAWYQARGWLW